MAAAQHGAPGLSPLFDGSALNAGKGAISASGISPDAHPATHEEET